MDEAFVHLDRIVVDMIDFGELRDEDAGVRTYIERCRIESPVELSIRVDPDGRVEIGSTPPLYYIETSIRPSYHRVAFTAELDRQNLPPRLDPITVGEVVGGQ